MYPFVDVKITYLNKPLSKKFFEEHKEIHHLYPTQEAFMQELYLPLLKKAQETMTIQVLEVSENTIKINGLKQSPAK